LLSWHSWGQLSLPLLIGIFLSKTHQEGFALATAHQRYFDLETRMLKPLENPFGPKVLPI
jgi:hypothetical protein